MSIHGLTVIPGSGKAGGSGPKAKRKHRFEGMADVIYAILPAPSRAEIRDRLSAKLKREITISEVDNLLHWLRKNAEELGWMPFYAPRGRNVTGEDRYIVVLTKRDGSFHDQPEMDACEVGARSTLRTSQTLATHLQVMLLALAGRTPGRKQPRLLRVMAADLEFVGRKLSEMLEEFEEANGTT